jgi:hypothetical protein
MKLRGLLIVLMLLGVIALEAKPKYRIETFIVNGTRMYQAQQKVWFRTSMGTLPFKVWVSGDYPFQHQSQAEEIIQNWKLDYKQKKEYKRSQFININ